MERRYQQLKAALEEIKNNTTSAQRSAEWYEARKTTLGGSEIGSVIGTNTYTSFKKLIANKIGISPFEGNLYTRWGKLFEYVAIQYIIKLYDIPEGDFLDGDCLGSVPHPDNPRLRYSPDGIIIAKINEEYYLILLEIKSPFLSIPDGKIPKHYITQPKMGMACIPQVDFSIFVNNSYRKCPLENINDDSYDTKFHKDKKIMNNVLARGVIVFYQTEEQKREFEEEFSQVSCGEEMEEIEEEENIYTKITNNIKIDFGKCPRSDMEALFILIDNNLVSPDCSNIVLNENISFDEYEGVGILPWKLFNSDVLICEREENFISKHQKKIDKFFKTLDDVNNNSDPIARYYEIFS